MNNKYYILIITILAFLLNACNDDFLEIKDPNEPVSDNFYTSMQNAQLALNGVYAEVHDERLFFGEIFYILNYSTGEMQYDHPETRYTDFNSYSYDATNILIADNWAGWYRIINRANNVLNGLYQMKNNKKFEADITTINTMIGQCYFMRGFAYSYLIRMYGQKMPSHPSYSPNLPGVIIADTVITTRQAFNKERNSCKEVYDYVINDFKNAAALLPPSWSNSELGKATKGAAYAYLGETYMYLNNWNDAKVAFDNVLANNNYKLVNNFSYNFDYKHIHNSESIFEVAFNNATNGDVGTYAFRLLANQSWNTSLVRSETIFKYSSGVVVNSSTLKDTTVTRATILSSTHKKYFDKINRYVTANLIGQTFTTREAFVEAIKPALDFVYIKSDGTYQNGLKQYVNMVSPKDPRLATTVYTPGVDSIWVFSSKNLNWGKIKYSSANYGMKKYIPDSIEVESARAAGMGNDGHMSMNFRLMRLDDVFLYYAEVMHKLGNDVAAKEYLNKVIRRAFGYNYNTVSIADINPSNVMEAIQNQTFLEIALEGKWWFHVRRWNRCIEEFSKYGFVIDKNECLPIPQQEMEQNTKLKTQNINYN